MSWTALTSPFEWDKQWNYSQGVRMGDVLHIAGQAANDADGNLVGLDDFRAQVKQAYSNMAAVLESNGSSGTNGVEEMKELQNTKELIAKAEDALARMK